MSGSSGINWIVFGLQITLIGTQVEGLFVLVFVGVLLSLIGFITDHLRDYTEERK